MRPQDTAILVMIPSLGTLRRARCVGTGRAKRLIFFGRCTAGREAALHRLGPPPFPKEGVFEELEGLMKQDFAAAFQGYRLSKLALIERFALRYDEILEHGLLLQDRAMSPEDFKEALASYREKRTPVWRSMGRPQQWEENTMEEIVPDVFTWRWYSERHGYDFNGHLLRHSDGNICVDPVQPSDTILDELMRLGVAHIVITNCNHSRAANLVRDRLGALTAIHPEDAAHARGQGTDIDDNLRVGERMGPLEVIGVAGKSPGEVALLWRERRILIVGDAVIGNPPGECSLLPEKVMDDPVRLRSSVRALLNLDFETLLVGDGVSILSEAKDRLRELTSQFPD